MATTLEELNRKIMKEALERASVESRLEGLTAEERLKGRSPEEIEAYLRALKNDKPQENQ
jgi:hypothetical protein